MNDHEKARRLAAKKGGSFESASAKAARKASRASGPSTGEASVETGDSMEGAARAYEGIRNSSESLGRRRRSRRSIQDDSENFADRNARSSTRWSWRLR